MPAYLFGGYMSEKFVRPHLSQRRAAADCINQALERRNLSLHWSRLDYLQRCADELTCPCNIPPREVRVRPCEGRTDEAIKVYGRAEYRGSAGA